MRIARGPLLLVAAAAAFACYHDPRPLVPTGPSEGVASEVTAIPSGAFTRGDMNGEPDEHPERRISVDEFSIERMEVSNASYRACVTAAACDPAPYLDDADLGGDAQPVVGVSWEDAKRYCEWIGRRLPTEAEWEYAARGEDLRRWPWEGAFDPKRANTAMAGDFHAKTAPVRSYVDGASPFGVLNLAGNVAEWVADLYDPTYYRTSNELVDPPGAGSGRERVVRGGSYADSPYTARVSARRAKLPTDIDATLGFRCAE